MKAFTYLITNNLNNKWYYGVRYARNCKTSDLFTTYFSSSKSVKSDIEKYGIDNFKYEIRKTFDTVDEALLWESRVLKKMKVTTNKMSYNEHYNLGFTVKFGDDNPSKKPEVRRKLSVAASNRKKPSEITKSKISNTKRKKNIVNLILKKDFIISKKRLKLYRNMLEYMNEYFSNMKFIKNKLNELIIMCENIPRKKRKLTGKGYKRNTGKNKIGKCWFTNEKSGKCKLFNSEDIKPDGWIKGMKNKERNEKIRNSSIGRLHNKKTKKKLSEIAKIKKYYTSPDLKILKVFYNEYDVPIGWIKGNKLKERNEKISKNNRWSSNEKN